MINAQMREYDYFTFGVKDAYGQKVPSTTKAGSVKMAINIASQSVQDNSLYSGTQFIGLTMDKTINDKCVIQYGAEKLKVLYVNPLGRYSQLYLARLSE